MPFVFASDFVMEERLRLLDIQAGLCYTSLVERNGLYRENDCSYCLDRYILAGILYTPLTESQWSIFCKGEDDI